jgi:hypothetical protein
VLGFSAQGSRNGWIGGLMTLEAKGHAKPKEGGSAIPECAYKNEIQENSEEDREQDEQTHADRRIKAISVMFAETKKASLRPRSTSDVR